MGETWLAPSYLIFVQNALPNDNEIVYFPVDGLRRRG
jgi:hypothetical protein